MDGLKQAMDIGKEAYMSVSEKVLEDCDAVRVELSTKPPGILKLLCSSLAEGFLKLIADYEYSAVNLRQFLWDSRRHVSVCTTAFRCVLSRFIERFDILSTSNMFEQLIILQNLDCVPQLMELSVSNLNVVDNSKLLASAIRHLKHLQIFKYRTYCSDEVILELRLHCPRLKEVDVSHSVNVTNASAVNLIHFTELKLLNLEGTQIDDENYGVIISKLPNISNVSFCENENSVLFHTRVKILDTITHIRGSFHDIDTVSRMCPNTTNITLTSKLKDLSRLTAFNTLRALEISHIRSDGSELKAILRDIGHRLKDLTFFECSGVNLQDIVTICPSLVKLSLTKCSFLPFNSTFSPQLPHFRNLINLEIEDHYREPIDFRYIRYYNSLQTIQLSMISIFTVELVKDIIDLGTFKQLEEFRVEECLPGALTVEALQLLIRHCPLLKRLEGLAIWPLFPKYLIDEMKHQLLKQNVDLVIEY
jgi:hypothetical protein